ncbi:MAG: hypothetical protein HQ556_14195 [Candidatus Marinimicrobia bacterium]|nr:hypothetical protein [Candidatus Neomarinimicrobiota bacterium]
MSDQQKSFSRFMQELRNRRVFRVLATYAVIAFVIIQIADIVFPALHLPEWTLTLVVVLLGIGFPVVFGLAWAFDITEKGVVRTPPGKKIAEDKEKPHPFLGNRSLVVITAIAIIIAGWSWVKRPPAAEPITSIAVLPLENLMNDPNQDYFVDGLHEALITSLSKIGNLRVISRTSVMQYKEHPKSLDEIAEELNVEALIEGSVFKSENEVRITAQLLGMKPERHLWAESYDRELKDILRLHSEVALAIAAEIEISLVPEEKGRLEKETTDSYTAYDNYLQARFHWAKRTKESTWKAVDYYKKALEIDSSYALAYSGLADCYTVDAGGLLGISIEESDEKTRTFARKALELDSSLAEPHSALAQILWLHDWDLAGADREFRRALELNPNDATSLRRYAWILPVMNKPDESIQRINQAMQLDPLSLITNMDMGALLYTTRNYEAAIEQCLKTLEMDPDNDYSRHWLAMSYLIMGMNQKAISAWEKNEATWSTWYLYLAKGDLKAAREMLENEIKEVGQDRYEFVYWGFKYVSLGDLDKAFEMFDKAYEAKSPWLIYVNVWPELDPIRNDPRYDALIRKLGLK